MNVIGIESSCDETSVSILSEGKVVSNLIASQAFHKKYGGVVPELSSRAHLQIISTLVKDTLKEAKIKKEDIDLIASTAGPGLIGALLVGLTYGKGLSLALDKPFIPVNHIEGHIFSGFLMDEKPEFPYLCLVVSGGHSLLLIVKSDLEIVKLGSTIDDAAGEAFDKVSKMIGLGYPGGPKIQEAAQKGHLSIDFPIARTKNKYDFSFSGVKTSVLRYIQSEFNGTENDIPEEAMNDIAASFQKAVVDALLLKTKKALKNYEVKALSLVGGVAANNALRNGMKEIAEKNNLKFVVPDLEYCGDNAAMIAYRGQKLYENGKRYNLNSNAFPSMPKSTFIEVQ